MLKLSTQQKTQIAELMFQYKFIKKIEHKDLIAQREHYKQFWTLYCQLKGFEFKDLDRDDIQEKAYKFLVQKTKELYSMPKFSKRIKDINLSGALPLDSVNQIIYTDTVEEIVFDENNNEIARSKTQEIRAKKIERIEFGSEITIKAVEHIRASQELADEWFNDYKKSIEAASKGKSYDGRFQFHHLELDRMQEVIETGTSEEIRFAEGKLRAIMKYSEMMEVVKRIEMQPLYTMNIMHEAGFNRQKELQGAVSNDRQMIDAGNIIVKEEVIANDRERLRKELKQQGYSKLESILEENLMAVGAVREQIEEEIKNPIIEAEVEDEFDLTS
jgi:hypothetical protein